MINNILNSPKSTIAGAIVLVLCSILLWTDKITPLESAIGLIGILLFLFDDKNFKKILDKFVKK